MEKKPIVIEGIKCVGWQKEFVRIFQELKPNDIFVIKASRQKGKSTILCQALLYVALNRKGSISYFISPTNNQCRKQFNDLKKAIGNCPLVEKMNETTTEIWWMNGSQLNFRSAESGENLRGNTVKNGGILCIDEGAFIKDDTIAILLPYVTVSKANIIIVSTPRRKNGVFYDYYSKSINGDKGFRYLDVNDFDNSFFITEEQIESYKEMMCAEKFKNEILGLFSDSNEGVFGDYQSIYEEPSDTDPVYCGIDFSTTGEDATVMSFFNRNHQQCLIWRDKTIKDPVTRCEKMAEVLNSYPSLQSIVCETNSMGSVYISLFKRLLQKKSILKEFTTTNTSKKEAVENVVKLIGKKEITLLPDKQQDYELSIYISMQLSKGNYTYGNDPKASNGNDDTIAALCLACSSFNTNRGRYVVR